MKHFYDILGLNSDSSPAEINEAYQKLSKKFDPHLNPGDQYFSNLFAINEAYQAKALEMGVFTPTIPDSPNAVKSK